MEYKVFFSKDYDDEFSFLEKEITREVLILDSDGKYYNPLFITLNRIKSEFKSDAVCYLETDIVILHQITKATILRAIPEIYKWQFTKRWHPLTIEQLEKYFYPMSDWRECIILASDH